jgi:hypothetical protein
MAEETTGGAGLSHKHPSRATKLPPSSLQQGSTATRAPLDISGPELETHCRFHGRVTPWTSAHFER